MSKQFARFLLWLSGWKVDRSFPIESMRCVMIAAPHTSNWDAYYIKLATLFLGIPMKVAIKDNWTRGLIGLVIRPLGGLGVDRSPKAGSERLSQVDSMATLFEQKKEIALAIAPEGTRRRREKWKMGFYWVACKAKVPITFGYLDYKNKIAGVGPKALYPSGNLEEDLPIINAFYEGIEGKHPENFSVDRRYENQSF